ncbi:hypothetical protein JCGZ_05049 [Jatropha curcas]|uniref:Phytocyanin domain-containing protein n=1 Tax=Jatropha curcas TaxID=180498 RepID=A0A067KRY5_JATCU|nr:hypothetical protein JCGZ_05049 [Jatropha curcas]
MEKGRGSAMLGMVLVSILAVQLEMANAAIYIVGGSNGWTFNVAGWPKGKSFKAGDVLGYTSCNPPKGAKTYTSGKDRIKLVKGQNFFICSFPGHCQGGMKIAVTAM